MQIDYVEQLCQRLEGIGIRDIRRGRTYKVHAMYVRGPQDFYVRFSGCLNLKDLEKPSTRMEMQDIKPNESKVIFQSRIVNRFIRGIVKKKLNRPSFKIFAMDYGFTEVVPFQAIFKMAYSSDFPPLAIHCCLDRCAPKPPDTTFTETVVDAMKYYINNEYCLMVVDSFHGDKMIVTLHNTCPNDIATMLALTDYTILGTPMLNDETEDDESDEAEYDEAVYVETENSFDPASFQYKEKELKVNDIIKIRLLTNHKLQKLFYAAEEDDYNTYKDEEIQFSHDSLNIPQLSPERFNVDAHIAHCNIYKYERAIIKNIIEAGSKASVYCIDTGATLDADISNLKEVPSAAYFETPGIAFQCTFEKGTGDTVGVFGNVLVQVVKIGVVNTVRVINSEAN